MKLKRDGLAAFIVFIVGLILGMGLLTSVLLKSIFTSYQPDLGLFALLHFAGYLFFFLSSPELFFIYLLRFDYSVLLLILIAIITALLAQIIDYSIGHFVSNKFLVKVISNRKFERAKKWIEKYGGIAIFGFTLSPFSSPIVVLVAAMLGYSFRKTVWFSFLGLVMKYVGLWLIF